MTDTRGARPRSAACVRAPAARVHGRVGDGVEHGAGAAGLARLRSPPPLTADVRPAPGDALDS